MSALCQKQTFCAAAKMTLFDHLVGDLLEKRWHLEAQCLGPKTWFVAQLRGD